MARSASEDLAEELLAERRRKDANRRMGQRIAAIGCGIPLLLVVGYLLVAALLSIARGFGAG